MDKPGRRTGQFLCTVVKDKLKIYDIAGFNAVVANFGDGEDLQLRIEEVGRKRTQAQSRFFHGPVLRAFMTLGYHQQECKDMLCLKFLPREVRQFDGAIAIVPGHTSDLSVEEFTDFLDACLQLAAENNIVIEDAGEWRAHRRGVA
jgi:hypothetical protein